MRSDSLRAKGGAPTFIVALTLVALNMLMVVTVFVRRNVKQRWFSRRDNSRLHWAQVLDTFVKSGTLPAYKPSRNSRIEMGAAEAVLLERWRHADAHTRLLLYSLFKHWGLLELRLTRLRSGDKWESARSALILGRLGCRQALPGIRYLLKITTDVAFIQALEYLGDPSAIGALIQVLTSKKGARRTQPVISALVRCARDQAGQLVPYLKADSVRLRETVSAVFAELASGREVEALVDAAKDAEPEVRAKVARALGRTGELRAFSALRELACDPIWYVRLQAVAALGGLQEPTVGTIYLRAMQDKEGRIREKAALGLYNLTADVEQLFASTEAIPQGHEVLVSTLDRHGITWDSLAGLVSSEPAIREKSRGLIVNLIKANRVATIICGVQSYPLEEVRRELARLFSANPFESIGNGKKSLQPSVETTIH